MQVHPTAPLHHSGVSEELLDQYGDDDSPIAFWQLSCPPENLLRAIALRILPAKAAAAGVERLWSCARATFTPNRRSLRTPRLMQLLQLKTNGHMLGSDDLDQQQAALLAALNGETTFESVFDDVLAFEEEEELANMLADAQLQPNQGGDESESGDDMDAEEPQGGGGVEDLLALADESP